MTLSKLSKRGFASDNSAGIHPDVLRAISEANDGHALAYGDDAWTARAIAKFREHFGPDVEVYFVFNGSAANVLGLQSFIEPWQAVVCTETAHLYTDECGGSERFIGCKLIPVPTPDGKLRPEDVIRHHKGIGDIHHVQLRAVSITNSTELGTIYKPEEIRAIADTAHARGLALHMDGARLSNAAAALGLPLAAVTRDAGVDVLSFGGTKNGLLFGEAIVFFDRALAKNFDYTRKQGLQLASKMRFIAAQFTALLSNDLWRTNAAHANAMARLLVEELRGVPGVKLVRNPEANGVFAVVAPEHIERIRERFAFYVWNPDTSEVRWMAAFDTTPEDVRAFAALIREVVSSGKNAV